MAEEQAIQQAIQAYLNTSNRPYNANNLIDEFAKKFKKPKVIKALQVLEDSKEIQVKLFGKIKIYLADQKQFPVPSEAELKRIDSEIELKGDLLKKLQEELHSLTTKNNDFERTPTNAGLEVRYSGLFLTWNKIEPEHHTVADDLKSLGTSVDTLTERLKSCKASGTAVSHLPPKHVMEEQIRASSSALGKRRRLCEGIIEYMLQDERGRYSREELEFLLGIPDS